MPKSVRIVAIALASLSVPIAGCASTGPMSVEALIAETDGLTPEAAFKVSSVRQEYEIVRALSLEVKSQALSIHDGKPYDVLTVSDPISGESRELWFDIGRFYGRF